MNLDRFNPLSIFLTSNHDKNEVLKADLLKTKNNAATFKNGSFRSIRAYEDMQRYKQRAGSIAKPLEVSDWGIDDINDIHDFEYHETSSYSGSNYNTRRYSQNSHGDYYTNLQLVKSNTDLLTTFIKSHYNFDSIQNKFMEKFKYNLITSTLLEDSMILSKNEQALANISAILILKSTNVNFNLKFNYNLNSILIFINLIIYCIKNGCSGQLLRILLIQVLRFITIHKLKLRLITDQNLNRLNQFLLKNYKINKHLITKLIQLKELHVFNHNDQDEDLVRHRTNLKSNLLNTLYFLNFNLTDSIGKLFDLINSENFEQYVTINQVNLSVLVESNQEFKSPIDEVVAQITKFHQLRKLFICQLLSINEKSSNKNFFVFQLMDNLNLNQSNDIQINLNQKILAITEIFKKQIKQLENFQDTFETFQQLHNDGKISYDNDDILDMTVRGADSASDTNLLGLIEKLDAISTNLKYFHKYNQSTKSITNVDELQEKMMIFNQFGDDLVQAKELYKLSINDLNNDIYQKNSRPSSTDGSSIKSGLNNKEFNLKSFHNPSIKKRYSLPSSNSLEESLSSPSNQLDKSKEKGSSTPGRKYKRLSAGLGLGLLTVVEEKSDSKRTLSGAKLDPSNQHVAYDDNYINILPQTYETCNQSTFDQLSNNTRSKKYSINLRNSNRFSMNSMNSTVSGVTDLISSTQLTNYNDDEHEHDLDVDRIDTKVSKEELRLKLEESFNRIYNLENENKKLKQHIPEDADKENTAEPIPQNSTTKIQEDDENLEENQEINDTKKPLVPDKRSIRKMKSQSMIMNPAFLNKLEQTLNNRPIDEV